MRGPHERVENDMSDILADLRDTLAGHHIHPWTGEDGLFARAAAEIETLRRDYAILLERWKEAEARKPLVNAETVLSGRMNQEDQ